MSTLKTNTIQNVLGTKSKTVDNLIDGAAVAWVTFNGSGTVSILAQMNVSSITDNGVADYTVNFTSALADANYAVAGTCASGTSGRAATLSPNYAASAPTTTACRLFAVDHSGAPAHTAFDPTNASAIFHR